MIDKDLSKALTKKVLCLKSKNAQVKIGTVTVACTVFLWELCAKEVEKLIGVKIQTFKGIDKLR